MPQHKLPKYITSRFSWFFWTYGFQSYPVYDGAYELSDKLTSLERQSFGATCSLVDSSFSAKEIKNLPEINWGAFTPDMEMKLSGNPGGRGKTDRIYKKQDKQNLEGIKTDLWQKM